MAKNVPLVVEVARGGWGSVACVNTERNVAPARDFLDGELDSLREGAKKPSAKAKFLVLFQEMANYGRTRPKRFKPKMDGLFAFQDEIRNLPIRFPCFQDGKCWLLTHGFIKPGAKKKLGQWPSEQVRRAQNLRAEYIQRKGGTK